MNQSWVVSVGSKAYGPYSYEQMRGFIAEGRIAPSTLLVIPGGGSYRADADPVLGALFAAPSPAEQSRPEPRSTPQTDANSTALQTFGRNSDLSEGEVSHFIIFADIKSRSVHAFEDAIFNLGQACPVLPQVWLLTSAQTLNGVRNALIAKLGTLDVLFVVDASHDKAAWYNFAPEAEARIRRVWKKPHLAMKQRA